MARGHRPQERRHPPHPARPAGRADQSPQAQEGGPGPLGDDPTDRRGQRGGAAHRHAGQAHRCRYPRSHRPPSAVRAAPACRLRLWDQHRYPGHRRGRTRLQRRGPSLRRPPVLHPRRRPSRRRGAGQRHLRRPPDRQTAIWGAGTTTVDSDSTHFRAYDQNLTPPSRKSPTRQDRALVPSRASPRWRRLNLWLRTASGLGLRPCTGSGSGWVRSASGSVKHTQWSPILRGPGRRVLGTWCRAGRGRR